jgi:PAS domain S-box-containing protein
MRNLPGTQALISFLERLWTLLVEPPLSVEESDRRRQIRLLATSVLVLVGVWAIGLGLTYLVPWLPVVLGYPELIVITAVFAVLLFAYGLNRKAHYRLATIVAIAGLNTGLLAMIVLGWLGASPYYRSDDVNTLVYVITPILFASLLLSEQALVRLTLSNMIVISVLPFFFDHIAIGDVILGPFMFIFSISTLILLVTRQRNWLERDRRAELTRQKERYQNLFDRVPVGLYRFSADGRILDANAALVHLLGYRQRTSVLSLNAFDLFVDPEARERELTLLEKNNIVRGFEVRIRRRDGEIIWAQDTCRAVRDEEGHLRYYEGSLEDMTKRKQAERALRESEERFRGIFENAPIGIYRTTPSGEIVMANDTLVDMLGYDSFAQLARREPMNEGGHPDSHRSEFKKRIIEDGRVIGLESTWERRDGSTLFVRENAHVVRDDDDRVRYYEGTVEDVTQRKKMKERLRRQERLAVVGQMAGGIAHDFRNFLTGIILYAQIPLRNPDLPSDLRKTLDTIVSEARRAGDLVQQILDFSRRSIMETERIDLVELTHEVADILHKIVPENIDVTLELPSESCIVEADPSRVQQVLMNLALNARDAMAGGGELRIILGRKEIEPGEEPLVDMSPGKWVTLSISDTGIGMTEDVQEHLFEPFFTTKEPGKGTGLGLAQVYGIVKQHQGHINVETEVSEGTTFTVYLPAHKEDGAVSTDRSAELPLGHGEMILLVEDEDKVRAAVREILESLGYRVIAATQGREALERLGHAPIDLLVTDLVMPEMGGRELIRTLKEEREDLRTVVMTGYAADVDFPDPAVDLVHKPIDLETVARTVRQALDGDADSSKAA